MEQVEWRDVPDWEGYYQVSNFGDVRSLDRKINCPLNGTRTVKGIVLSQTLTETGYKKVKLSKNNKTKSIKIHQLVAMAFLGHKRVGYSAVVDHINHNKTDNRVKNLRIISQRENANQKHIKSTSKYVGVFWCSTNKRWVSAIVVNRKSIRLGTFDSERTAAFWYLIALRNICKYDGDSVKFRKELGIKKKIRVYANEPYITYDKARDKWVFQYDKRNRKGMMKSKRFASIDEAKKFRDNYLNELNT